METKSSKVFIKLITEEQRKMASEQHLNLVQVSFPNKDIEPINLASKNPIDDNDIVEYVKDLGLPIDKLRIDHWKKK